MNKTRKIMVIVLIALFLFTGLFSLHLKKDLKHYQEGFRIVGTYMEAD